jgi:hypothetical protein
MNRGLLLSFAAAATMVAATGARAELYDQALVSPPGWYNGGGNPNGGFTVTNTTASNGNSTGTIELGLRAKLRQNPNVIDSSSNLYVVPGGFQTVQTSGGQADTGSGHAAWNYEYSVELGNSGFTLANTTTDLTVTDLEGDTFTATDIFHAPFSDDNSLFGPGGVFNTTKATPADPAFTNEIGAQNSENPIFGNFPLKFSPQHAPYTYDPFKADTYTFTLDVYSNADSSTALASDTMQVEVTPLPPVVWAGLLLMAGVGVASRLKRRQGVLA